MYVQYAYEVEQYPCSIFLLEIGCVCGVPHIWWLNAKILSLFLSEFRREIKFPSEKCDAHE